MGISFIIVNYRSEQYLARCVSSILANAQNVDFEIIVVNNDPKKITCINPGSRISIIECGANDGFGKACNIGAEKAKKDFLFFINPDTELQKFNLSEIEKIFADSSVGAIAPKLFTEKGALQDWSVGHEITLWDIFLNNLGIIRSKKLWQNPSQQEVSWASGASLIMPKKIFTELFGFDDKFFLYFEDVDLCKRLRATGKIILSHPTFEVVHFGGQSSSSAKKQKTSYYASQVYYFQKHSGLVQNFFLKNYHRFF